MEAVLDRMSDGQTVLDIGTGTGCIAVSLAAERAMARVVAVDVSPAALAVARRNAEKHAVSNRIEFLTSDAVSKSHGNRALCVALADNVLIKFGDDLARSHVVQPDSVVNFAFQINNHLS